MAEREKRITVKVPEELHRKVKVKAALVGKSVSDILREYLEQWASDVEATQPKSKRRDKPMK
jgi:plasmid stability protein